MCSHGRRFSRRRVHRAPPCHLRQRTCARQDARRWIALARGTRIWLPSPSGSGETHGLTLSDVPLCQFDSLRRLDMAASHAGEPLIAPVAYTLQPAVDDSISVQFVRPKDDATSMEEEEYAVTPERWWVLFVFCLLSFGQSLIWVSRTRAGRQHSASSSVRRGRESRVGHSCRCHTLSRPYACDNAAMLRERAFAS